ncbi:HD domain-containing phosphohydrolase [Natranaerobius thermophilus]|uniref:Metal dependent phosphohydrolase n=1 Tax=Natranaerobius thermophilus (strain ATCC BAA-1301 / DSM 18059 / JW/NM-WN-LF) TaxID=457570 RepID=B2A2X9_NATTJ|nr:HD domain-containing phosphohydrolase [Natranaerobius thermophilus]ACB86347.1 metal dependent phosphohydrolase [Natranaerobius thermophilus JW/NM-WN-LF]
MNGQDKGIFYQLSHKYSLLHQTKFTKSSMLAVSHALEDIVISSGFKADMYVFFQHFKFFIEEIDRYLELAKICNNIYIFTSDVKWNELKQPNYPNNLIIIELNSLSPLIQEWNVIVDYRPNPMILATRELDEQPDLINWEREPQTMNQDKLPGKDDFRAFLGILSFDTKTALDGVKLARMNVPENSLADPAESSLLSQDNSNLDSKTSRDIDTTTYFINRALNEIEDKTIQLKRANVQLQEEIKNNKRTSYEMIKRLCFAAEYRDVETALHLIKMSYYSKELYRAYGANPTEVELMTYASLTHDIGKIGIPDRILMKAGRLTSEEYQVMKRHPYIGARILQDSSQRLINMARNICYYHHEKYNGKGYPLGLKGTDIPLEARIVAIADVFDALSSKRVYKQDFSKEKTLQIMLEERNNHFDGELLDLFFEIVDELLEFKFRLENLSMHKTNTELLNLYLQEIN